MSVNEINVNAVNSRMVPVSNRKPTFDELHEASQELLYATERPRVMIAIPNLGNIDTRLMMKLLRWTAMPTNWSQATIVAPIGQIPHDSARNYCVDQFLQTDDTHLFFLDDDVVPPVDALELLLAADVDVISGLYPSEWFDNDDGYIKKRNNVFSEIRKDGELVEAKGKGIVPIRSCGGGCLLIKRHVVEEKVQMPWFKFHYNDRGLMDVGEDVDFCKKVHEAGVQLYAHMGVQCNHVKTSVL